MTALTNAQIDRMTAELMGWHKTPAPSLAWIDENGSQHYWVKDWHPSEIEHLNQAWQVAEKLRTNHYTFIGDIGRGWNVEFVNEDTGLSIGEYCDKSISRAICLAALQASADTWIERTIKLINEFGGEVINQMQGIDYRTGQAAFMIIFRLHGDTFKIIFPVLEPKSKNDLRAAKIQAATILYHDIKARLVSAMILGARNVFFGNLLLEDGKTAAELEDPKLSINRMLQIETGDIVEAE